MELIAPAGNLAALKAAVLAGADAVYLGLKNATNARNFAGLNFTEADIAQGVAFAHQHGRQVLFAINTFAQPGRTQEWRAAVDAACRLGADALILADPGVLAYASRRHPNLNLHLSVQGSATNAGALNFFQERYGIRRAVLPRVLSLAQVKQLASKSTVPIEVFAFGSLCIMAEGRCHLSSYLTGESPNLCGVCSPAKAVRWSEDAEGLSARLNGVLIDRYAEGESAGYPTLCKGRFVVDGQRFHALEEPTSLNTIELIPELVSMGVAAVKIEGRQRSPAYVEQVTKVWRAALDAYTKAPHSYSVAPDWRSALAALSEGSQTTLGAYHRAWQ